MRVLSFRFGAVLLFVVLAASLFAIRKLWPPSATTRTSATRRSIDVTNTISLKLNDMPSILSFYDIPRTGFDELLPFIQRVIDCDGLQCACDDSCVTKCHAPIARSHCHHTPIRLNDDPAVFNAIILRHPVRRIVSDLVRVSAVYQSPRSFTGMPHFSPNLTLALSRERVVRANIDRFVRYPCLDNGMTKMLAGFDVHACVSISSQTLTKAKENLRKFDFVGIDEHLRESAQLLKSKLLQKNLAKFPNVPASDVPAEKLSPFLGSDWSIFCLEKDTETFVEKSNRYDLQLYDYAVNIFRSQLARAHVTINPYSQFVSPFLAARRLVALLHIPKTAGTAFLWVVRHILGCEPKCVCTFRRGCHRTCPYIINQCGHTPFVPDTCKGENVFTVVLLRHPVDRVISAYKHAKTRKDHCCGLPDNVTQSVDFSKSSLTLSQFALRPGVSNLMVKMLAGIGGHEIVTVDEETYNRAEKRLRELSFIGIQEQYDNTVKLLFHALGGKAPPQSVDFEKHNARHDRGVKATDADVKLIHNANLLDYRLYNVARKLFYARLYEAGILQLPH